MPNQYDGDIAKDTAKPRVPKIESPASLSTVGVVPYFPNLKRAMPFITSCMVFTYLEIHHAAPQDLSGSPTSLPVTIDVLSLSAALQLTRRTLGLALFPISTVYRAEQRRWAAARARREFVNPDSHRYGTTKLYSIVATKDFRSLRSFILRRNLPLVRKTLADAGFLGACICPNCSAQVFHFTSIPSTGAQPSSSPHHVAQSPSVAGLPVSGFPSLGLNLAEMMLRGSVLASDRRSLRYPRLRKAVEDGLEEREVLSAKQPKRKMKLQTAVEAVEPVLPDAVADRLMKLQKQGI